MSVYRFDKTIYYPHFVFKTINIPIIKSVLQTKNIRPVVIHEIANLSQDLLLFLV